MTDPLDRAGVEFQKGLGFARAGDFSGAAVAFEAAADAWPGHAPSYVNLGAALAALGKHQAAVEAFDKALAINPGDASAHFQKGLSLQAADDLTIATLSLIRAIELDPDLGEAHYYLGTIYLRSGKSGEARACLNRSVELESTFADAFVALGAVQQQLGACDEARRSFEQALKIDPSNAEARSRLLFLLASDCDWEAIDAHHPFFADLGISGAPTQPFNMLALEDRPDRHLRRSANFAAASFSLIEPLPVPTRLTARPEKLRIGYFSADFRDHATMFLAARMFELRDRESFRTIAYSYGRDEPGPMRERARVAFDHFRDVRDFSDRQIAELARQDGIDIAVDLKGYTEHQRVAILAYRPAPIQMSFLGYPGSLGASFIDYLIVDQRVVPSEQRDAYAEKLIFMPQSYQPNDDVRARPVTRLTRQQAGLPSQGFIFCCFNSSYKIGAREFALWMALLDQVAGSCLWLLAGSATSQANLRAAAQLYGINPERLIFAPKVQPDAHSARHQFADLFLDTFNCNAHTTASDALWAGVPMVTKVGDGFAARVGASLLHAVGLDELVTSNEQEYLDLALDLATNPDRLARVRGSLAQREALPLFDSACFTRQIEHAFNLAYCRYSRGLPPADLNVPA